MPNFYGLMTVKGRFASYDGTLELGARAAAQLTIDAASLDTGNARRDKHLRSADFFDVEHHPQVRFTSTSVTADGDALRVRGRLEAAGEQIPLELVAAVHVVDGELEVEAVTYVDQRRARHDLQPARHGALPEQADRPRTPRPRGRRASLGGRVAAVRVARITPARRSPPRSARRGSGRPPPWRRPR